MIFHFSSLRILRKHHHFLKKKMWTSDFFLVWGCIRDIILWLNKSPEDIDFTMPWNPLELYESINKDWVSHFITEKFWTITLIPKNQKKGKNLKYELTPLRAETGYADFRHPEEIFWSDDLLLDYQRRDFTINALYYYTKKLKTPKYDENKVLSEELIIKVLNQEGFIYLKDFSTLIVQDRKLISQLFPKWKCDVDFLYYLLDIQKYWYSLWEFIAPEKKYTEIDIIIDPALWLHDIYHKKLQTVWDPDKRFQEDALRLLRALRFVNVINKKLQIQWKKKKSDPKNKIKLFDFDPDTWKSVKRNHELLKNIAKERIREELVKTFISWDPFSLVWLLDEAEMLSIIFPALALTKHVDQPIRYHPFDVYTHILLTLYHLEKINDDYLVRFAMLYHDVWKVWQYAEYQKDLSREEIRTLLAWPLNHRNSSAVLAWEDFSKLWFSNKEIEEIEWYIKEHHTPWEILQANPNNWEKKLRKMLSENWYERVNNLLDINIADRLWMYNPLQNASDLADSWYLKDLLLKINKEEGQFTAKDLVVTWKDIMDYFNIAPWKLVWELLGVAMDWVLWNIKERNHKKQIFANLANYLKNKKNHLIEE